MANVTAPLPPGSYDSRVPTTIGVTIFSLSIASVVVVLRTYTRGWITNQIGVDDYFAVASLFMAYGTAIAILSMVNFGLGHHVWMLKDPLVEKPLYQRAFYVSIVLYCAGLLAIKLTFLFQYYRVFGVGRLRRVFVAAILVVGAWSLSQVLIGIFICSPVAAFWRTTDHPIPGSTCVPTYPQFYVNAAGNVLTDVVVLVMPFPLLRRLNLPPRQRLLLFAIFGLGFFTVAVSALRIRYLKLFDDFTWQNVESSAWSMGELCSGITCACLPTLRPFLKAHLPGLETRLTGGGDDGHGYGGNRRVYAGGLEMGTAGASSTHKRAESGGSSLPSLEEAEGSAGPANGRSDAGRGEATEDTIGTDSTTGGEHEGSDEQRHARLGPSTTVLSAVEARNTVPRPVVPDVGGIQPPRASYQVEHRRGSDLVV